MPTVYFWGCLIFAFFRLLLPAWLGNTGREREGGVLYLCTVWKIVSQLSGRQKQTKTPDESRC